MIQVLKNVFNDIVFLYKNFIHWNISKILIDLFALLLGLLFALPFLLILLVFFYFDSIKWGEIFSTIMLTDSLGIAFLEALSSNFLLILFYLLLGVLIIGLFLFGYSYKIVSLSNLYINYKNGEKLLFLKNIYFDKKSILTYLYILSWIGLILLIPIIFFIILVVILINIFGGFELIYANILSGNNTFMFFGMGAFLISFLLFFYIAYRLTFSYIIFLDKKDYPERNSGFFYIKESFKKTKGFKIFKFILVMIIFSIFMVILDELFSFIEGFGITLQIFIGIIAYLLISGLFEMIIVSSYFNIIKDRQNKDIDNTKIEI